MSKLKDNTPTPYVEARPDEFTSWCNYYYTLTVQIEAQQELLDNLLENAPLYNSEKQIIDIDAIIKYYRDTQAENAKLDRLEADMRDTERTILQIMRHFEIPANFVLTGQIPFLLEYEIWADDNDYILICKTRDLEPEVIPGDIFGDYPDAKLSEIRIFGEAAKKAAYSRQTADAQANGVSNCPHCATGDDANKHKIWKLADMDADYITALSNGDATSLNHCEMFCKAHNRLRLGM